MHWCSCILYSYTLIALYVYGTDTAVSIYPVIEHHNRYHSTQLNTSNYSVINNNPEENHFMILAMTIEQSIEEQTGHLVEQTSFVLTAQHGRL